MLNPDCRFDYVIRVPDGARAALPWTARLLDPGNDRPRLLGHSPTLGLEDFDERIGVARTRITLTASSRAKAKAHQLSFVVDRALAAALSDGDELHVASGYQGGLGLSILRGGQLIAAAGVVTGVPLGRDVCVSQPAHLASQADAIFQARDPNYEMWERPVEIAIGGVTRLLHRARLGIGGYDVFVVHGFIHGRECAAISLTGVSPDCAANLTAPLLEQEEHVQVRPFETAKELRETDLLFAIEAARVHLEAGELETAHHHALLALSIDRDNDEVTALVEEIERRM